MGAKTKRTKKPSRKAAAVVPAAAVVAPEAPPAPAPPAGVTRAVAAEALGVPPNRISQWVADGAPVMRRGHRGEANLYDVDALRVWYEARRQEVDGALSLEEERAKLAREQRLKMEREARVREGELVEREEVIAETRAGVLAVRTRILQLPRQLGQAGIIAREREPEVVALLNEALRDLATWTWTQEQ